MADEERPDVTALIAALDDPSGAVRTAALRALVRLPLATGDWQEIDKRIAELLGVLAAEDIPVNGAVGGFPPEEVIQAAIFHPSYTPFRNLRNLLKNKDPGIRKAAARALSRARDHSAITELLEELENPFLDPAQRADAAQFLSLHHAPEFNDQLVKAFTKETEPPVRLWIALAIARYGETGPLCELEHQLDAGTIAWGDLDPGYGLLDSVPDKLSPYPPFYEKIAAYLRMNWFRRDGNFSFFLWDACNRESPRCETPGEAEEKRATFYREAKESLQKIRDWFREHALPLAPPLDSAPLDSLTSGQATQLISVLVRSYDRQHYGFVPVIGRIAQNFSGPFRPDTGALFASYLDVYRTFEPQKNKKYPMWQIAWLISRGSLTEVLAAIAPHLSAPAEDERIAAARLIEDVARLRGQAMPPVFGGSSSIGDVPAVDVQEHYTSAKCTEPAAEGENKGRKYLAHFARTAGEKAEPPAVMTPPGGKPARVVNTVIRSPGSPDAKYDLADPLKPGQDYYFCLNIGPHEEDSGETTPKDIPHVTAGSKLLVALFSVDNGIRLTPGADTGCLTVHKNGTVTVTRQPLKGVGILPASKELRTRLFFPVHMPEAGNDYRLRCNIYHKQFLLQSRIVRLHAGAERDGTPALVSDLDYTLMQAFDPARLAEFSEHRMSIMLNEGDDATYNFYVCGSDGKATVTDKLDIDREHYHSLIEIVRNTLRLVSWDSLDEWNSDWDSSVKYRYSDGRKDIGRLTKDLIRMAINGHDLYSAIGMENSLKKYRDALAKPGIIQVAMKNKPKYYLPLAFIYDTKVERNGQITLCPEFKDALETGKNLEETACMKGTCRSAEDSKGSVVCPGRFWGFRHEVSMPLSVRDADAQTSIPVGATLNIPFVRSRELHLEDGHFTALKKIPGPVGAPAWMEATSKAEVFSLMKKSPHIIYFYCHGGGFRHDAVDEDPFLQAGPADKPFRIFMSDICDEDFVWDVPRPLVFLNGCHTAAIDPIKAMNLVEPFLLQLHCAGVIGTEITIFEEMATVFAEECLRRFLAGEPVGQAIRGARLKVLEAGNPLGLAYIPFAPADLRLKKSPPAPG